MEGIDNIVVFIFFIAALAIIGWKFYCVFWGKRNGCCNNCDGKSCSASSAISKSGQEKT